MNSNLVMFLKVIFGLASRVAPKVAGRAAFRLFCTTVESGKQSPQRKLILENARKQFEQARRHNISYPGGTVAAFEFTESIPDANQSDEHASSEQKKTVWLVHGWQSNSLFMNKFIEPLLGCGFRVVCIDLPGHGDSSGRTFHLPLGVSALHAVRETLGEFDAILSHSLGGAVVATTLAGTMPDYPALPVAKLVLISAPDSMSKIFDDFSKMMGLNGPANKQLHAMVTKLSGKITDDFNTGAQLQGVSADLLLIHAPDDKEVPFSESESIAKSNPAALLEAVRGLGHRRIIASDEVVETAVEFIGRA